MMLSLLDLLRQQGGRLMADRAMEPWPDWVEEGAELVLRLSLPGIDRRSVQIQVSETGFSLSGHRSQQQELERPGYYQSSASYGSFVRTLPLPVRVVPRQSRAIWRQNGLLEIRLRKA